MNISSERLHAVIKNVLVAAGADEWDAKCQRDISTFMESRGQAQKPGNCVAISACYYGSVLVKIGGDLRKVAAGAALTSARPMTCGLWMVSAPGAGSKAPSA